MEASRFTRSYRLTCVSIAGLMALCFYALYALGVDGVAVAVAIGPTLAPAGQAWVYFSNKAETSNWSAPEPKSLVEVKTVDQGKPETKDRS